MKCPRCESENTEKIKILGSYSLHCNNCSYDESEELETQNEKSGKKSRNVYRTGGGRRSAKRT